MNNVYLCGFEANRFCDFARQPTCQLFNIEECTRFASTTFEEFGLTEIYVLATKGSNNTFGFGVFIRPDCTGDPYGIRITEDGMAIDECRPLSLPFIGNQADFIFVYDCPVCTGDDNIVPDVVPLPDGVFHIDYPRIADRLLTSSAHACTDLGFADPPADIEPYPDITRLASPLTEPYLVETEDIILTHKRALIQSTTSSEVVERLWCQGRNQRKKNTQSETGEGGQSETEKRDSVCVCLSVCLSVCLCICLCACLSVCLFVCLFVYVCSHKTAANKHITCLVLFPLPPLGTIQSPLLFGR